MIQSVLRMRLPEVRVAGEHEPVVGQPDPLRAGEQVVVREREVQARDHRVEDEDEEPDDPRRHEQQRPSRTCAAGDAPSPRAAPAVRRPLGRCSPLTAMASLRSSGVIPAGSACRSGSRAPCRPCLEVRARCRPGTCRRNAAQQRRRRSCPSGVICLYPEFGFGEDLEERGELRVRVQRRVLERVERRRDVPQRARQSLTSACVSGARYFTSSHASAVLAARAGCR